MPSFLLLQAVFDPPAGGDPDAGSPISSWLEDGEGEFDTPEQALDSAAGDGPGTYAAVAFDDFHVRTVE